MFRCIKARVYATGGQPVTQLIVMARYRKYHAKLQLFTLFGFGGYGRLQGISTNRIIRFVSTIARYLRCYLLPYCIANGAGIAV